MIIELDGMAPETNMSGETSDITNFYEFGCYQWVYFRDTYVTFPGYKLVLGRYCGPSIDFGPLHDALPICSVGYNTLPVRRRLHIKCQLVPREGHICVSKVYPLIPPIFTEGIYFRCFS